MGELVVHQPMIHVDVPARLMVMSPKPEPEAEYSESTIKRWYGKLVSTSRCQEAALILHLAFTRPRLLYQVMKLRKAIAGGQRRQATLAERRHYMATHRAAQKARGILPRPRSKAKAKAKATAHAMPLLAIVDSLL